MRRIRFHPDAKVELTDAARWYESQLPGLGREFRLEAEAAMSRILSHPEAYGTIEGEIRCHAMHRFPYGFLYHIGVEDIFVAAVMHLHRDSQYWRDRL